MNNSSKTTQEIAESLRQAYTTKVPLPPIRDVIGLDAIETAYAIQKVNTNFRINKGAQVVGAKIGLTSKVVQRQLGVDQPDFGILFNDMEVLNGGEVPWNVLMQPKAEAEIAFVMGKDLKEPTIGTADVLSAIDYALSAIEIVGSRVENWNIKLVDTIADNASSSHFVLGHRPVKLGDFDLINCKMQMEKNGEKVSEGKGADCLGSPINAMIWLARTLAGLGNPLRAGDVILTGALGPMADVKPGDFVQTTIEGLGSVSVTFGADK